MHRPEGRMARSQARRVMAAWCMVCRSMGALRLGGRAGWGFLMREGPEEALQQARPQCWGLWWPALTSVLPEGSCTELPRGRLLCPARGSSVQDASGWESAGSEAAWWPQHSPHQVLGSFSTYPHSPQPGAWLWAKEKAGSWLSAFSKKQGCFSYATKSAGSGLPNIPRHLEKKKKGLRIQL